MATMKRPLVFAVALVLAAATTLFAFQRSLMYFPGNRDPLPQTVGLQGVTRTTLATPDGETLVLWYAAPDGDRPVILFLHGNAGEIAHRANRFAFYQAQGYGVAFLSWRGYGGSTGNPSEAGLITDAQTAYDHLRALGHAPDSIVLVGESLGTGPAVQIAATNPVAALVLEAPFPSTIDVARVHYPWLPARFVPQDQYRSADHIGQVTAPVLVLHGENDSVIPFQLGMQLFQAANQPKTFTSLGPVGHAAISTPTTWEHEVRFIDALSRN